MFSFDATIRTSTGKAESRRLRHSAKIPGVIYGGKAEPVHVVLSHDAILHAQEKKDFYASPLTVQVNNQEGSNLESCKVTIKAIQRHPFKPLILHVDFLRA